jgi:peptide/nickel transport system permease protein
VQYGSYVTGLLHGDLGTSLLTRRPVATDIAAYLPATLELVLAAMGFAIVVGIPLGLVTAVWRNRWPDYTSQIAAIGAISMPRFFLGLLLQLFFAMWLMWLPLGGRLPIIVIPPPNITGFLTIDSLLAGEWGTFTLALRHLALPAIAMSLSPLATIMRMMRSSTIEVMQQDYVLTARALGLSPRLIITKYVARNAISATLTVIGLYFGWLLGGTVLVETVFDWPGLGLYATKAIVSQDMMPVIGVALVIGLMFVVANLIIDVLYGVINPKVRYS